MEVLTRAQYAHAAELEPSDPAVEPAAVGAAVTTALCGHWEHEGPCRWPNNHVTAPSAELWSYRVLFVAPPTEEAEVRERIEKALRADQRWRVLRSEPREVAPEERTLAGRLAQTPRLV